MGLRNLAGLGSAAERVSRVLLTGASMKTGRMRAFCECHIPLVPSFPPPHAIATPDPSPGDDLPLKMILSA